MTNDLSGVVPPVVTPFDDAGDLRESALRDELRYHADAGVHGVSVCGSTGEGNALSVGEHERVYEIANDEVGGDMPVVAGVIATSAREAVRKADRARDAGCDYLMVTPPYYQEPTEDGLVEFFATIGREVGLPILIYDVIEKVDVTAEIAARMVDEVPELYGIKQSGGDMHGLANMLQIVGDDLVIMSALDDLLYPSFALGANGSIAGTNGIIPRLSVELWEAVQAGDHARAREIHEATLPLARATIWGYDVNFPGGVKAAVEMLGRDPGSPRVPIIRPADDRLTIISDAIDYMHRHGVRETVEA